MDAEDKVLLARAVALVLFVGAVSGAVGLLLVVLLQ